jgi:HEAT repeat protein
MGGPGDISLLRGALLAAAYLRDPRQISYAIDALSSEEWQVVQAAGKLLTETPDPSALTALQEALRRWSSREERSLPRTWV